MRCKEEKKCNHIKTFNVNTNKIKIHHPKWYPIIIEKTANYIQKVVLMKFYGFHIEKSD